MDAYWNKVYSDVCKAEGQNESVDKSREEYLSDCICPPTKRNLTLMRCITYHGIGKSCVVDGSIYQCRKVYFHDI